jgi:hypothetical protein
MRVLAAGFVLIGLLTASAPAPAIANPQLANLLPLRDGLMPQENLALGTYPHYNVLTNVLNSPFAIHHSPFNRRIV